MTEKLKQKIEQGLLKLPKEIRDTIKSSDWEKYTEEIGKNHKLTDDEINDFQIETSLVLLALVDPEMYITNIEDNLGMSRQEAEKIAQEVNQKILNPIYRKMIENIKNNLKDKTTTWEQNINFILSGGDYTAFLERVTKPTDKMVDTPMPEKIPVNYSKIEDMKSKFTI